MTAKAKRTHRKAGRRLVPIDPQTVKGMAGVGATNKEIGEFVGCDGDTIGRRFADILTKARAQMCTRLRQKQFALAMGGNVTMCIFLGKQMLGQADEQRIRIGNLEELSDDQLMALTKGIVPQG